MAIGLYTLDVGHGLCQIILFPGRRAIVIDGGDWFAADTVGEFLQLYVDQIIAYIATHNDKDHIAAALQFLELPRYRTADGLHSIYALIDRGSEQRLPLLEYALRREEDGTINMLYYETVADNVPLRPRVIHEEIGECARLELLYPRMSQNIRSIRTKTKSAIMQNRSSACLRLTVGDNSALITGDIDLIGLTRIVNKYRFDISADVLTVPHHGGRIPGGVGFMTWAEVVGQIRPRYALVSCGVKGNGGVTQLSAETCDELNNQKALILCTELTSVCCDNCREHWPGMLPPYYTGVPQLAGKTEYGAVACGGSIVVVFEEKSYRIEGFGMHQEAVRSKLVNGRQPLCRPLNPEVN